MDSCSIVGAKITLAILLHTKPWINDRSGSLIETKNITCPWLDLRWQDVIFLNQQVWHPCKVAVSMNLITWNFKSKFWRDQPFGFRSPIPSHLHWQIACPWRNKISFWPVAHVFGTPWTSQISCVAEIIQVLHGNPIFWCVKFHALEPDFFPNKGTHIIFSG